MKSSDNTLCAFCDSPADLPHEEHAEWCEHKILAKKIKAKPKNEVEILKSKIAIYEKQIMAYETTLELISIHVRPDGTYNRSREACERLAKETLKKFNR